MDLKETPLQLKQMIDNSVDQSLLSNLVYQEEDSYLNPSNCSKINQSYYNVYQSAKQKKYDKINNSFLLEGSN